jgi:hypothetical protein
LINDIGVLSKLPQSSRCKQLFTFEFTVKALYGQVSKANSVPQTPKDWETVFEKALLFRNDQGLDGEDYVIDIEKIEEDTAYMAREAIKRDLVIHCKVRILVYIFKTEDEVPSTPKAYTYIGVLKLSCRGCRAFFTAFNRVHNTRFVTKGSHNKSCWPWQFPQSFPKSETVLSLTYSFIAQRWVGSYDGYVVQLVPLAPDSDAQTDTGGDIHVLFDPELLFDSYARIMTEVW